MININLLPSNIKAKRAESKQLTSLIMICLAIVLVVALIAIISKAYYSTIQSNLEGTKNDVQKNSVLSDEYLALQDLALLINDRWQITQAIDKKRVNWLLALQDLNNSVPVEVQFENLTANTDKSPNFTLQGNAKNDRDIIKFKEKLEESPYFKNVNFKSSSLEKAQDPNAAEKLSFTLEFDIEQ